MEIRVLIVDGNIIARGMSTHSTETALDQAVRNYNAKIVESGRNLKLLRADDWTALVSWASDNGCKVSLEYDFSK
jgi:predicted aldo/keto reductase-like oxidoreductase